ncbi:MAG: nitroreductase family protein [Candidatus Lokiarchaeota archaeon]|nr:nitroreductase family protein [Candidatus Lokiarchaeota archaeon]
MNFEEVIYKRRTIRRFKQDPISLDTLKKLVDYARVAPMAKNVQALDFILVQDPEIRKKLFPLVGWAGSLPQDQRTPEKGREPTAYIILLVNKNIKPAYVDFDVGAAAENILLGAVSFGLGSCWMGNVQFRKLKALFEIPDIYEIKQVISLGYPDEESDMEPFEGSFTYWKTPDGKMHVPKRNLDDIIFKIY